MKTDIYGVIYITTNMVNNKQYIGQHKTNNMKDRYLGSGYLLRKSIKKYGKSNFSKKILDVAFSREELDIKEIFWIGYYKATKSKEFYNIHLGGSGGNTLAGYSEEELLKYKKKMSVLTSGDKNGMYGRKHTFESRFKMSETRRTTEYPYFKSEEFKQKMSNVTSGEENGMYGRSHSFDSRLKMSINSKGKTVGNKNGMYGKCGENAINGKQVIQYSDIEMLNVVNTFNTISCALKYLNIKGHISLNKAIKNKTMYKGYYWSKEKRCRDYSERK